MIKLIIDLLQSDDFYGAGEYVELAKGRDWLATKKEDIQEQKKRLKYGDQKDH